MSEEQFPLKERDFDVIRAAIRLGDWILKQPITDKKRSAVLDVQAALKRLPAAPEGNEYDYTVDVGHGSLPSGEASLVRSWAVSFSRNADKEPRLEIYSIWTLRDTKDPRYLETMQLGGMDEELGFEVRAGGSEYPGDYNFDRWIREVDSLDEIIEGHTEFEIDAYCN